MKIPIQNIYYLLCYAWNKLEESEVVDVNALDSTQLIDLFANVLSKRLSHLFKRGLDRYYIDKENSIAGIKGKLNMSQTIKQGTLTVGKTVCSYDEFDYDILHNQILKATTHKLLMTKNLKTSLRDELHLLYLKFPPISEIKVTSRHFSKLRFHRNNYHYDFLMKVCQILNENLLIDETTGELKFMDFTREEKAMARLFEAFVRNFYKHESSYKVSGEIIRWQFGSNSKDALGMLPTMNTDITLRSAERKIIIDTKYYKEAFKAKYDRKKIISSNLYQIFAYVKNQENESPISQNCQGILLYPSVNDRFEYNFTHENHKFSVVSIDLNQDWQLIRRDLLGIIA
jgi:5-methylcytosine-specific restriction enzyme subunit McrC